jgi:IS30 family transposase
MTEAESTKELVTRLMERTGMTPIQVVEALDNRVSVRTVYRWLKGESEPGNKHDHEALRTLVTERCGGAA